MTAIIYSGNSCKLHVHEVKVIALATVAKIKKIFSSHGGSSLLALGCVADTCR